MSHHGIHPFEMKNSEELNKVYRETIERVMKSEAESLGLGATGNFPDGKIDEDDEGELKLAVTHYEGNVFINFGKSINFLGLNPDQAIDLAQLLIAHSEAAKSS